MKPTLGQVFALSLVGLVVMLGLLVTIVLGASSETIEESAERLRDEATREVEGRVTAFLSRAPERVRQFQAEITHGLVDARDPAALEAELFALLLADQNLGELSLTYGTEKSFDADDQIVLEDAPRGELSVSREAGEAGDRFWSRHIHRNGRVFVADRRELRPGPSFRALPVAQESTGAIPDPTEHLTFKTPARRDVTGQPVWSDLHWSQLDDQLPEAQRRVEVSVQQAVVDTGGKFLGVLRVGLLTQQLDRAVQISMASAGQIDPHHIFICDAEGRLITRLARTDELVEFEDALRISPANVPAEVVAALTTPILAAVSAESPRASGRFRDRGEEFLVTFRALPETQEWIVGIVVPRSFYLGRLTAIRHRLLFFSFGIVVLVVVAGGIILRSVKRAQARIVAESLKMNRFDFAPTTTTSGFRDVSEILESLEKAKTAMRAMGKYAPVDLVRRLYQAKAEPVLGGEEKQISVMFTDIKDFTTFSEQLPPNDLATALGRYLEVMARIIQQETRGTIDKYIGDAIMTIWNAPEPVRDHARMACRAALLCREAGRKLASSPDWEGLPPFETRFGLHLDSALVGHFGAPDRMNYTAIGDAINLASRLEGLNKEYGTTIIVSETIMKCVGRHFVFRLLDWVAVKGKNASIKIYELLGEEKGTDDLTVGAARTYEEAFAAYLARDFARAIEILEKQTVDPPSHVLCERCRLLLREPPSSDWRGVHVFKTK
jgi:adenylate cyclase